MTTSYGDGSWELSIAVAEAGVEKSLRVKGDLHVGGLMVRLVHELGECISEAFYCDQYKPTLSCM